MTFSSDATALLPWLRLQRPRVVPVARFAAFFDDQTGFGIAMVQALDSVHAMDICRGTHPTGWLLAVPAELVDRADRHGLLREWVNSHTDPALPMFCPRRLGTDPENSIRATGFGRESQHSPGTRWQISLRFHSPRLCLIKSPCSRTDLSFELPPSKQSVDGSRGGEMRWSYTLRTDEESP